MVLYVINSVITKLAIILMNKATVISCIKTQGKFRGTQGKHRENTGNLILVKMWPPWYSFNYFMMQI